ncbi:hypothetical protein ACFQ3Z_18645 [Streptomyces nogalater]
MAAILLNFSKTDLRHIDETFLKEGYLEEVLPSELADSGTGAQPEAVSIPGLDLEVPATTSAVSAARALNDRILRAAATVRDTTAGLPDSEKASAQALLDQAKDAFDRAIENAGRDARLRKRKQLALPGSRTPASTSTSASSSWFRPAPRTAWTRRPSTRPYSSSGPVCASSPSRPGAGSRTPVTVSPGSTQPPPRRAPSDGNVPAPRVR